MSLHVDMFVSFFSAAKINYSDRTYTLLSVCELNSCHFKLIATETICFAFH